jgi:uncharacterized delta-60 repeat protein
MSIETSYGFIANSVELQIDNKILVAGYSLNLNSDFALARLNADGSLDTSFGLGGKVFTSIGSGSDIGSSVTLQADGKILVAGYSDLGRNNSDFDFAVIRYNINGTLDTSFGVGGKVTTPIGNPAWGGDFAYKVGVQDDGKIVVSGSNSTLTGSLYKSRDFAVVRYNSDGSLDNSYGSGGVVTTSVGDNDDQGVVQYIQSDGKVLVGGWSETSANSVTDFSLVRYNSDGSLDSSFGSGGKLITPVGSSWDHAKGLAVQSDGKIIQAGSVADYQTINGMLEASPGYAIVRYNSDGSRDNLFGNNGVASIKIGVTNNLESIILQPDGKILLGGWSSTISGPSPAWDFSIARFNSDGTLDTTFNNTGFLLLDFNGGGDYLFDMKLRSDGVIVAVGFTESNARDDLAVALIGTNGEDDLDGTIRVDKFYGFGGDDSFQGGVGADYIDGGDGLDTADYSDQTLSVIVALDGSNFSVVTVNGKIDDTILNIENLVGGGGADTLTGDGANNYLIGGLGGDLLSGGDGDDTLYAGTGNDAVSGGGGSDLIIGGDGAGNDTYDGGDGVDTVKYTSAKAAITVNLINSKATSTDGADIAGIGTDILTNIENIIAGNFNDMLTGNFANNQLLGGLGNDTLDGGSGTDSLIGGLGNDTYVINDDLDTIVELMGEGTDLVKSSVSFSLETLQYVENITFFTDSGNVNGTGNLLANIITGSSGNNTLDGGLGVDTLIGGMGNDLYIVDDLEDLIVENAGSGIDLVSSNVSYELTVNVEKLSLAGNQSINGLGNFLNNEINGNSADNYLNGGYGKDTLIGGNGNDFIDGGFGKDILTGGPGNDVFNFSTHLSQTFNIDTIADFTAGDDVIQLDRSIFTEIRIDGVLSESLFCRGSAATQADDRIIYDQTTGALYYDADGAGINAAVQIALIGNSTHPNVLSTDFLIIV